MTQSDGNEANAAREVQNIVGSPQPASSGASWLKDVQNILGFFIAGFAGILSFLGLRSGEVSNVLRDPSTEKSASVVVILLFLAALAAVLGVALPGDRRMSAQWAIPITLALLAIFSLIIFVTPLNYDYREISSGIALYLGGLAVLTALLIPLALRSERSREGLRLVPFSCSLSVFWPA
jgi:hypothetical protein